MSPDIFWVLRFLPYFLFSPVFRSPCLPFSRVFRSPASQTKTKTKTWTKAFLNKKNKKKKNHAPVKTNNTSRMKICNGRQSEPI